MIVKDVEFDFPAYMETRFGHASRTEGLHVSTIYGDLDKLVNAKRYTGAFTEDDLCQFGTIGFLWERVLEECLDTITRDANPGRYWRPGEQLFEGLLLTPDYADLDFYGDDSNVVGLEEWKVTWKSVNKFAEFDKHFWRWLVQMKAYCYVLKVNVARLRVLFIVGDWKTITPQCRVREFTFTDRELEENWSMLTGHARRKGWL